MNTISRHVRISRLAKETRIRAEQLYRKLVHDPKLVEDMDISISNVPIHNLYNIKYKLKLNNIALKIIS